MALADDAFWWPTVAIGGAKDMRGWSTWATSGAIDPKAVIAPHIRAVSLQ